MTTLAFSSAGCASMLDSGYRPEETASAAIRAIESTYVGRPESMVVARYGIPEQRMTAGTGELYQWTVTDVLYFDTQAPLRVTCRLMARVEGGVVVGISATGQAGACAKLRP